MAVPSWVPHRHWSPSASHCGASRAMWTRCFCAAMCRTRNAGRTQSGTGQGDGRMDVQNGCAKMGIKSLSESKVLCWKVLHLLLIFPLKPSIYRGLWIFLHGGLNTKMAQWLGWFGVDFSASKIVMMQLMNQTWADVWISRMWLTQKK